MQNLMRWFIGRFWRGPVRAYLALVALALLWGYNWVATKIALDAADPFVFAAWRTLLGAAALFALAWAFGRSWRVHDVRTMLWLGLLQTTGFVGLSVWAVALGAAGSVAMLAYTMPFWAVVLAHIFLNERLSRAQMLASALAALGMALMLLRASAGPIPALLAVAAGMLWAASAVFAKHRRAGSDGDLLALTAWQMLCGGIPLALIAGLSDGRGVEWSPGFVGALVYITLSSSLGWVFWLYALRALPAGIASLGTLAAPVIAALAAWWQLGEQPTDTEALGMWLIGIALAVLSLLGIYAHRRPEPAAGQE